MIIQGHGVPEDIPEESDEESGPDDVTKERIRVVDKETNTDLLERRHRRGAVHDHASRNSVIRRSQTFSPAGRALPPDYICKLNRSDSDTKVQYKRDPFQRNSLERRSLRLRKVKLTFFLNNQFRHF